MPSEAQAVLDFWFGPPDDPGYRGVRETWFRKDPAFDAQIRQRFGALIERKEIRRCDSSSGYWCGTHENDTFGASAIAASSNFNSSAWVA